MMLSTGATILIIENNPEILDMTRLAVRSFRIYEQPIRIVSAKSVQEAINLFQTRLVTQVGISIVPVMLIALDVETPGAGLELCRFIREDLRNREIQLYLRVDSSPPEHSVFDQYMISGYYMTAEIAEGRLYSLIRNGVDHSRRLSRMRVFMQLAEAIIMARSKSGIKSILEQLVTAIEVDIAGQVHHSTDPRVAFMFDGEIVAKHLMLRDSDILAHWRLLREEAGVSLSSSGDKYVVGEKYFLIHIGSQPHCAEFDYLCPLTGETPDGFAFDYYRFARLLATVWKSAY